MGELGKYNISFSGLKEGIHHFDYKIDESFFICFENSWVSHGNLQVTVELDKKPRLMIFSFSIQGVVEVACDRCLDLFDQPVRSTNTLYVKFGTRQDEFSEDLVILQEKEHSINLAQFIYEYIILSIPVQHIHPDDADGKTTCNSKMISKLDEYMQTNESPKVSNSFGEALKTKLEYKNLN